MDINVNVGGTVHIIVNIPDIKKLLGIASPSEPASVDKGEIASILNDIQPESEPVKKVTSETSEKKETTESVSPVAPTPSVAPTAAPVEQTAISNADLRTHLIQVRRKAASQGKDILPNAQLKEKLTKFGVETLNELNPAQVAEMYAWVDQEAANA